MLKKLIINILKAAFAFSLIYWLVKSDKLDLKLVEKAFQNPLNVIFIILLMLGDNAIAAYRWKIILDDKAGKSLSYIKVFLSNWIGIFFNCVLPGSVTGDLVKIFYVKDESEKFSKKFLLASVFLDRLVGLFGLIAVGGISCLVFYSFLTNLSEDVKNLVHINLLLFAIVIFSFIFLYAFKDFPLLISKKLKNVSFLKGIMEKCELIWLDLCEFRHKLVLLFLFSVVIQGFAVCIFWYVVSPYADSDFLLKHAFSILPIGMISIALPIAPAGLGVGHFVYEKLFSYFSITNGANLFNVYFIVLILTNLTGVFAYIFHSGKKVKISELKNEKLD